MEQQRVVAEVPPRAGKLRAAPDMVTLASTPAVASETERPVEELDSDRRVAWGRKAEPAAAWGCSGEELERADFETS